MESFTTVEELTKSIEEGNVENLQETFFGIVSRVAAEGKDAALAATELVKSVKLSETATDALVDALWMVQSADKDPNNESLLLFVNGLDELIPLEKLFRSVDSTLLVNASPADWPKKLRLINTQMFYRQQKFNLLHEESEGFAKFLSLLFHSPAVSVEQVEQLIGTFRLDPNRCLGLAVLIFGMKAVDVKENNGSDMTAGQEGLLSVIAKLSQTGKLAPMVGFEIARAEDVEPWLAAITLLVRHHITTIGELVNYLPEWRETLEQTMELFNKTEKTRIRNKTKVRLSGGSSEETDTSSAVDKGPLVRSVALKWFSTMNWVTLRDELTIEELVALSTLFPQRFGRDILGKYIQGVLESIVPEAPWSERMIDTSPAVGDILQLIEKPFSILFESGALKYCPGAYSLLCRWLIQIDDFPAYEDFFGKFLLPGLSIFTPNPSFSIQLWKILDKIPYQKRYEMYSAWKGSGLERAALGTNKPLWLQEGEIEAGKNIRYVLKRLSKDTVRDMARAVAKVCHSFPLVVFTTILNQIESYDNLVQVMVDSLRFVTPLSLDVLGFCILGRLSGNASGVNRSRLKEDGVNVSQWMQSLEAFTGAFYKGFPYMELRGIISYVTKRLMEGHVLEIGMLRTLLKTAGGWAFSDYSPAASLSMNQLQGRSGSILLKKETMSFGVIEDFDFRASRAVRSILQKDRIAASLLILLSKVQNRIIFDDTARKPIKLVGYLVDTCQAVKSILLDFMTDDSDPKERITSITRLAECMPPLEDLNKKYSLDVPTIWMLSRPLVRAAADSEDDKGEGSPKLSEYSLDSNFRDKVLGMLPGEIWQHISLSFYESFYRYSSYELFCPEEVYLSEIDRLNKVVEVLKKPQSSIEEASHRLDSQSSEQGKIDKVLQSASILRKNMNKQKDYVSKMSNSIARKVGGFFPGEVSRSSALTVLNECIFPRCMQGPDDAIYCVSFILMLHENETAGFGTLHLLEDIFIFMSRSLYGCTEGEAANISLLFSGLWKKVSEWRYDKDAFSREVEDLPGSQMECDEGLKKVTYDDFEKLYTKWHNAIGSTLLGCLRSTEYMHQRNSLVLLTRLVGVFPTKPGLGNKLLKGLAPLQEETNKFADIRASAQAYSMQLLRARDDGVWKEEDQATVAARLAEEKAAAKARQAKAEKQMEELKRDSEKITAEIGDNDRRGGRGRGVSRDDRQRDDRPRLPDDRGDGQGRERSPPPGNVGTQDNRSLRAQPPPYRGEPRSRDRRAEGPYARQEPPSNSRALEVRWNPKEGTGSRDERRGSDERTGGRKRTRAPSPEEGEARRDDMPPPPRSKRSRNEEEDEARSRSSSARRRGRR